MACANWGREIVLVVLAWIAIAPVACGRPTTTTTQPTLSCGGLTVRLDSALPRPSSVQYNSVDFTAPVRAVRSAWWHDIPNQSLLSVQGSGICPSSVTTVNTAVQWCTAFMIPGNNSNSISGCAAACEANGTSARFIPADCHSLTHYQCGKCRIGHAPTATCAGWSVIKVTPTSGQRGKSPLCQLFTAAGIAPTAPFYSSDPNFECGTKVQVQPDPPNGGSGSGALPTARACITVVAANGSTVEFCAERGEAETTYTSVSQMSVVWNTTLSSDGVVVALGGTMSVAESTAVPNATDLEWVLASASSDHLVVRAVDPQFGFVGLPGDPGSAFFLTHQSKTWCPPGTGCQEWGGGEVACEGGGLCSRDEFDRQLGVSKNRTASHRDHWVPPTIPWAFAALTRSGRSAFAGGANGDRTAGFSGWSSQPSLPFQGFGDYNGTALEAFSAGASRINTNLRCGSVLPVTLKWGLFGDVTDDGTVSQDDAVVYAREQYPVADWVYRAGLVVKLDSDITSYTHQETMPRISFNSTLEYARKLSLLSDNTTTILTLVGWQGSGHDTAYPTYDQINPNLGTIDELRQLAADAREYNVIISYHVNTDEAYKNLTATQGLNFSVHPVPGTLDGAPNPDYVRGIIASGPNGEEWVWSDNNVAHSDPLQGPTYHISKTKDAATGLRWQRLARYVQTIPTDSTIHSDAYRDIDDSWETDERGFIAEDEEATCGLQGDATFLASHNLSFGVEGSNGCLCAIGPVPGFNGIVDYYWHGDASLGTWNRIIGGTSQGLDQDIAAPPCPGAQPFDWTTLGTKIYMQAMVYAMQMTDSMIGVNRFRNGGTDTRWPYGGDYITYRSLDAVFVPAVLPPPRDAPKTAPTTLSQTRIRVFTTGRSGSTLEWRLPASWQGKEVKSTTLTETGPVAGPSVSVAGRVLTMLNVPSKTPIILTI